MQIVLQLFLFLQHSHTGTNRAHMLSKLRADGAAIVLHCALQLVQFLLHLHKLQVTDPEVVDRVKEGQSTRS